MGTDRPSDEPRDVALWRAGLVLALLVAATGMLVASDGPFERGWLAHNGARYAIIARHHERLGLTHLGGAPLVEPGEAAATPAGGAGHPPHAPVVYAHHPPALGWTIALVFRAFGVSERAASVVPILATLALLILFARLVRVIAGARAGAFAALAAAVQPMIGIYGSHVDVQGAPVLLFSLATLVAYRHWLGGGRLAWLLAASLAASAFDWYGLYMPVACAVHLAWTRHRPAAAAGLVLWSLALFGAWLAWLASLPGVAPGEVFGAAGVRGLGALAQGGAGLGARASAWLSETLDLMPAWPGWLVMAIGVALRARRSAATRAGSSAADEPLGLSGLIVLLLLPPVVHGLLFPAGMLMHGYWLFGLPLPLAVAAGVLLARCPRWISWPALALLLVAGIGAAQRVMADVNPIAGLVGREMAARTAPGDVVLTNYDCNPFVPGVPGDSYVLLRPEVAFYADRTVRGGLTTPASLADALARRPDADWFLEVPWPIPPDEALDAALRVASEAEPELLQVAPPVYLYRLRR